MPARRKRLRIQERRHQLKDLFGISVVEPLVEEIKEQIQELVEDVVIELDAELPIEQEQKISKPKKSKSKKKEE